ncbi:hypothetical protein [Pelosinus sp. IPA-1]|uniref:hypothetical protein n=1 Tax=Pelosinus sp. IPA-1 TaxID=3029569 RepID=UPI0024361CBE|nr:hypothetical protein [Pelosinus sp. IPA-1]GMB00074.1 hypothetical protein PIPA1_28730 [Pelosinus sp. IPA-1]
MNAKKFFLTMFCAIPEGMELANEPCTYEVTFLTNIGFIQGTIDNEFIKPFEDISQKIAEEFTRKGIYAESLTNGDIIPLKDVVVCQPTGCQISLPSLVLFSDQIVGVTIARPIFSS